MDRVTAWVARLQPDRVLAATVVTGAVLSLGILVTRISLDLAQARMELSRDLADRGRLLETQLTVTLSQLQAVRRQAVHMGTIRPADPDTAASPGTALAPGRASTLVSGGDSDLLAAFLDSNRAEENSRLFTLDRPPAPFMVETVGPEPAGRESTVIPGNVIAMTTLATRRRPGLSRPDAGGWIDDAALGIALLPLMDATRKSAGEITRVWFATISGVAAYAPWAPSATSSLLDLYPTSPVFTVAAADPTTEPVWDLRPAPARLTGQPGETVAQPGAMVTAALPVMVGGGFRGIIAADLDLAAVLARAVGRAGEICPILLTDRNGLVLAATDPQHVGRTVTLPDPSASPDEDPRDTGIRRTREGQTILHQPVGGSPLVLVRLTDTATLLLPTAIAALTSLGLLVLVLGLVLLVSHRLMRRALEDREAAVAAERSARAASDRALDDLRAAHDELDFLNREKTRFFSLISHDLRGPFNALLGMTEELARHGRTLKPDVVSDFAATTHESARKVFELLENLLQWSRVQMSGKPFVPSVFPLRELVADAIGDARAAADAKDIHILDAVGDRWVLADRTMVLAVLRNLLVNAVKFSYPGGVVHITSRALGDRLEVAVTDHGIGMEEEQVRTLLRSSGGQTSRPGTQGEVGTGLGLTLVRDLVLRHGGELKVTSTPGNGTVVSFTVPLTAAPTDLRLRQMVEAD
ncbi:MAG: hypothetical protein RLY86_3371 [Pseudomonadota bacterium]|jgi:signal transduction histidine kinase